MMNKRLLSLICVLAMLLTACIFSPYASAEVGIEHETEVSRLNAFGILSGYPNAEYKADAQVTAKEFINAAYRLTGNDGNAADAMAKRFGFSADDKTITLANAEASLLTALGFNARAEANGGYPAGYHRTAAELKLLRGINLAADAKLTYDATALMLYNALDVRIPRVVYSGGGEELSNGDITVLENLGIYSGAGVVTGTQYAAVTGSANAAREEIIIDGRESYKLGRTYADELFGYYTQFYYNSDKELLWIDSGGRMRVTRIAEVDISDINASGISYYNESGKKKSAYFDSPTFVRNGQPVQNPDMRTFVPESGYIVLLDNDGDGRAEVVCCEAYEYYLVSSKNETDRTISDFETGNIISLNPNDYDRIRITKDGGEIVFADIANKSILAVMRPASAADGVLRAVVSGFAPITGKVTAVSSDEVKIDGTSYKVSTAYRGGKLSADKSGTFYLDINGHIVRSTKGNTAVSQYAYLIAVSDYTDDYDCYIQILTAGGTVEKRRLGDRVRHRGGSYTPSKLIDAISAEGGTEKQLIVYSLNNNGEINRLETADKSNLLSGSDDASDEFSLYFQGRGRYRKNNLCFNSKYLINADTPIFVVPSDRRSENYKVSYASGLTNGTSYHISVYDIDEYMTAGAVVLDELASEPEQLKAKRSILVDSVSVGMNEDGELVAMVEGYQQGSKVTLKSKDKAYIKDAEGRNYSLGSADGCVPIVRGDVIQTSLDTDGKLLAFRTLYKINEDKKHLVIAPADTPNEYEEGGNANEFADMFILCGRVIARSDSVLVVQSQTRRAHKITNGAAVYIVNGRNIEKVTVGDIGVFDNVYLHTYQGNLQEVIIYK